VERAKGAFPLAALVPQSGFDNPNAVLSDLCRLIDANRAYFESGAVALPGPSEPLALLLLGRSELGVPQISSPATLPAWFPVHGGELALVVIEDLTHTADAPLSAAEPHLHDIRAGLYELERTLVARLSRVACRDHRLGQSFFALIKSDTRPDEKYPEFLNQAKANLDRVSAPAGYRPRAGEADSVVGRMLALVCRESPDRLLHASQALATALDMAEKTAPIVDDSLIAVLLRPTTRASSKAARFALNALVTTYASAQIITAAAHAHEYPTYSIRLIESVSRNLAATLGELTDGLTTLA
jgi:hypothetical protein